MSKRRKRKRKLKKNVKIVLIILLILIAGSYPTYKLLNKGKEPNIGEKTDKNNDNKEKKI